MATLILKGGKGTLTWQIIDLSKAFNTENGYTLAGIASEEIENGGANWPSGEVYYINAPTTNTEYQTDEVTIDIEPGSYTFYGFTRISQGTYWQAGSATVVVDPIVSRPEDWSWDNIKKGAAVPKYGELLAPVSATDWNSFCDRINSFRIYKSLPEIAFTTVSSGTSFSADIVKEVKDAISEIEGAGALPTLIEPLKASFWNGLSSALNAIK